MKTKILIALLFGFSPVFLSAQDNAKELFSKSTEVLTSENIELKMALEVTDNKGRLKEKELKVLKAKFGAEEKTKVIWLKPERAKGTTIIISKLPGQTGDIEVFTPSNEKTRKLKATDSNMKLIGTEFNMASFANYDTEKLKYSRLSDTTVNGITCYQIEVSGTTNKDNSSAVLAIDKDSNFIILATRFDEKHQPISQSQLLEYQEVGSGSGKMYPMLIITDDYENKKHIVIRITSINVRSDLTKSSFTL